MRGAGVDVDGRRLGRIALSFLFAVIGIGGVALGVAAVHHDVQINDLTHHGVPVEITSTGCLGLLGGSGSNSAGNRCSGTFTYGGKRYHVTIPGTALHPPGSKVRAIAASDDPSLVTTPGQWRTERASVASFVVPVLLLAVGIVGGILTTPAARRRRTIGWH